MAINADFIIHEDGTKAKLTPGDQIYEGSPLTLDATTGSLKLAAKADKVYGLSKVNSNQYQDLAFGEFGAFGSGMLTVVCAGQVEVSNSIFNEIEITTATQLPPSSPVVVALFDNTKQYVPNQALYVDAAGLISNTPASGGKASLLGKVLQPLAIGSNGPLVIEIFPMNSTVASTEMA